ncbi:mannitol dehydrogenase family protein [Gordonia sp. NPDC003424]
MTRLSIDTLGRLTESAALTTPARFTADSSIGLVHMGIGAFHRAHQAVYTEEAALATGSRRWGICGVTQRSASVRDALAPQGGLYGILTKAADSTASLRISGIVREILDGPSQTGDVLIRIADPAVTVVTLTVSEKGYRRGPDGHLDLADAGVRHDLEGGPPTSAIGRLVRGLQRRRHDDAGPITVLCCDNLNHNGRVVAGLVADFCAALPTAEGDALADWIGVNVTFPNSMVDRIVPATTAADRAEARTISGLDDEGLVTAEPFSQWVIEDRFAADRPAWELAGAQLTADVAPYELMKLRILNGSHSTLAYLGALQGHPTIADAIADPRLRDIAGALIHDEMIPTLTPPDGADLAAYGDSVLERYTNPGLRHTTVQIAMDGSQKLPQRLVSPVAAAIDAGRRPRVLTLGVAGWMTYVALGHDTAGTALPLDDPLSDRLGAVRGMTRAEDIVGSLLDIDAVFGHELPEIGWWKVDLESDVRDLLSGHVPTVHQGVR